MDKILEMKPLTLEELQKMNGQPVFVITKDGKKFWALVNMNSVYADNTRVFFFDSPYSCKKYGEIWLAYAYHPTHIERENWKPCKICKIKGLSEAWILQKKKFCQHCGRPLTEEGWEELERSVRG